MKKIISILSILSIVLLISCKKSHVCSCVTTTNTDGLIGEFPVNDSVIDNMSKKNAFDACNNGDTQTTQGIVITTVNCELK
jgi:hypothetical protein